MKLNKEMETEMYKKRINIKSSSSHRSRTFVIKFMASFILGCDEF